MRYAKQISTGWIIETQGGGNPDNPLHLSTMVQNAVGAGFDESDVEVGYADDSVVSGWLKTQNDAAMTYSAKRKQGYTSIGDQLDMQYKDLINGTTTWKDHIAKVKSDNPKG
jgi:hypothetical protein|tara:strand:- start:15 stop:350 length:336 start_codon:yes stop_codon:yes gene_type:complete